MQKKKVYIINNINILRRINKKKKKEYVFVPDERINKSSELP